MMTTHFVAAKDGDLLSFTNIGKDTVINTLEFREGGKLIRRVLLLLFLLKIMLFPLTCSCVYSCSCFCSHSCSCFSQVVKEKQSSVAFPFNLLCCRRKEKMERKPLFSETYTKTSG